MLNIISTFLRNSKKLTEKVDMNKVTCIRGDVTLPEFGLAAELYAECRSKHLSAIHLAVK